MTLKGVHIDKLGFADDIAIIDPDATSGTISVTNIANECQDLADMVVNVSKTESMIVQPDDENTKKVSQQDIDNIVKKHTHSCERCPTRRLKPGKVCKHTTTTTVRKQKTTAMLKLAPFYKCLTTTDLQTEGGVKSNGWAATIPHSIATTRHPETDGPRAGNRQPTSTRARTPTRTTQSLCTGRRTRTPFSTTTTTPTTNDAA